MGQGTTAGSQKKQIERQLENQYILEQHPLNKNNQYVKLLFQRKSGKNYLLRIMTTNSKVQSQNWEEIIGRRINQKEELLLPLHHWFNKKIDFACGGVQIYYLMFRLVGSISLQCQINKRSVQKQYFTERQLLEGLDRLIRALIWLKHHGEKNAISHQRQFHGSINTQSIFIHQQQQKGKFMLGDPLVFPQTPCGSQLYPSPQKLMLRRNLEVDNFDPWASDLFSIAMCILEASVLSKLPKIYYKNLINYDSIKDNINKCPHQKLKKILDQLLLGSIDDRKHYLNKYEVKVEKGRKIKMVSIEKNLSKNKSKGKLQLTSGRSNKSINTKETLKEVASQTCLSEFNPNTQTFVSITSTKRLQIQQENKKQSHVKFNYSNRQNNHTNYYGQKSSYLKKEQKIHNPYEIEQHISRIDYSLALLQRELQTSIRQNTVNHSLNHHNEMSMRQTKKPQDKIITQYSLNENSEVEYLSQTHKTEESHLNSSLFKDSLQGIVEEFKEYQRGKLSEEINKASYSIAESKIEVPADLSNSNSQGEIQFQEIDNSISYVANMQGTQLQALSNLTIPEEAASKEESIVGSVERQPKGDFLTIQLQNGGKYIGYMSEGMRNGFGTFYYQEGGYYEGDWRDNKMNGHGQLFYQSGKLAYDGLWYKDQFHGRGKVYNEEPQLLKSAFDFQTFEDQKCWVLYDGDLVHDCREGYGKLTLSNGQFYAGQFREDKPHGKGFFSGKDESLHGYWNNGSLVRRA